MIHLEDYVEEFTKTLPASKAVFSAELGNQNLYFHVKNPLVLNPDDYSDPLESLIVKLNSESFSRGPGILPRHTRYCSPGTVLSNIKSTLIKIYERNCGLKNPKLSAVHKFIRNVELRNTSSVINGLVLLYRYAGINCNDKKMLAGGYGIDEPHIKNIIAILNKMKDKYDR